MWEMARETEAFAAATAGAVEYRREIVRLFGIPESEIANTLRAAEAAGLDLAPLEITTCLRRGEIEVSTRFQPAGQAAYDAFLDFIRERHADTLYSEDGSTIDDQLAELLTGHTLTAAESCTAGLFAGRITDRAGSSAYFLGGGVVYSDQAKIDLAGVDPELIERFGAVSTEVAEALAQGIAERFAAELGVGITGIAGPGGGTPEKPVGLVCFSVWMRGEDDPARPARRLTRRSVLPGGRSDIRDRSVTVAMHMLRRVLLGESDEQPAAAPDPSDVAS
jgi:nicotinamide-nucleotide amidase